MPDQINSPEFHESSPLERLPAELGFSETAAMQEERQSLEADYTLEASQMYQLMGEQQIDDTSQDRKTSDKQRIGLIISIALIRKKAGMLDDYRRDLEDAANYAYGVGLLELAAHLEEAISSVG